MDGGVGEKKNGKTSRENQAGPGIKRIMGAIVRLQEGKKKEK